MTAMKTNSPDPLESAIDRELKRLPELAAPRTLAPRVMAEIHRRNFGPRAQASWDTWSPVPRMASLAGLVAVFAAICFGGWELWGMASAAAQTPRVSAWVSAADTFWTVVATLFKAGSAVLGYLGPAVLICGGLVCAASYAACVGLGTAAMRYALARR